MWTFRSAFENSFVLVMEMEGHSRCDPVRVLVCVPGGPLWADDRMQADDRVQAEF